MLTLPNGGGTFEDLTALDKTSGVDIGAVPGQRDRPVVQTIKPAAVLRMVELIAASISLASLAGASLEMNEFAWRVVSYRLRPSPKGENDGEVFLILAGRVPLDSESESES